MARKMNHHEKEKGNVKGEITEGFVGELGMDSKLMCGMIVGFQGLELDKLYLLEIVQIVI